MRTKILSLLGVFLLFASLSTAIASGTCPIGVDSFGAQYMICVPTPWNGDLVVFAHGYVSPLEPVAIPLNQLSLPDGTSIPGLVTSLGYAFATTSYRENGLAVIPGIDDLVDLVTLFRTEFPATHRVYLVGASEGGLITTLALEQHPDIFSGGMTLCGPIGDFRGQINYWDDFRVIFDYFFPQVFNSSPIDIPDVVMTNWESYYLPIAVQSVLGNPSMTSQLLKVTHAPIDPADPTSIPATVGGLLWYNVFATNDAKIKLKGQPYDNWRRWYFGSNNDFLLNLNVFRVKADHAALKEIDAHYQTTGKLQVPLVSMHTTGDPIVPYWQSTLYQLKVLRSGSGYLFNNIPILRYGHVNFKPGEALAGFALLVLKVSGNELFNASSALKDPASIRQYLSLARQAGAIR